MKAMEIIGRESNSQTYGFEALYQEAMDARLSEAYLAHVLSLLHHWAKQPDCPGRQNALNSAQRAIQQFDEDRGITSR